jgi:hypothetical protein
MEGMRKRLWLKLGSTIVSVAFTLLHICFIKNIFLFESFKNKWLTPICILFLLFLVLQFGFI